MGLAIIVLFASFALVGGNSNSKHLIELNEKTWKQMLSGEWMVKFYAPWCPACQEMKKSWNSFADWSKDLDINVAAVDVTTNPGLSGRFLVTALPTVYHVKDGVFRSYAGSRDKDDLIGFIEQKKWTVIEPVSSWKHPDTAQMTVVAMFFQLSMSVRDLHNYLTETQGLPPMASYLIFGIATLVLGCLLGFLIVCLIDCVFPTLSRPAKTAPGTAAPKQEKKEETSKGKKEEEEEKANASQSEESEYSQSQSEGEESEHEGEVVRQRRGSAGNKGKESTSGKTPEEKKKK